jgi:hypothetical protein
MLRAAELMCNSILLFILCIGANGDQCGGDQCPSSLINGVDEETSLLQVGMQTHERSKAPGTGPWKEAWLAKQSQRASARKAWADKKAQEREMWKSQTSSVASSMKKKETKLESVLGSTETTATQKLEENDVSSAAINSNKLERVRAASPEESEDASNINFELIANPFLKSKTDIASECPEFADQPSCDEAIWLAGLLAKLAQGKTTVQLVSQPTQLVSEASTLLSLEAWFESPAGPSGFFNFLDKDKSGALDSNELEEYGGTGLLQIMDVDDDGYVSRHEARIFLRGLAVLFKKVPQTDSMIKYLPPSLMVKLADTVTLDKTVPVGPNENPFTNVRHALKENCPPPATEATCEEAMNLTKFLDDITEATPKQLKLFEAGSLMGLWLWFENPGGPSQFFSGVDSDHRGTLTPQKVMAFTHSTNPKVTELLNFIDTNNDGVASRYEIQNFLRSCALLIHHLPVLDVVRADSSIDTMFTLADSVVQQAVRNSSPQAWGISVSCSVLMISCILYAHCWPSKKKGQDELRESDDQRKPLKKQYLTSLEDDSLTEDTTSDSNEEFKDTTPSIGGPTRLGSTYKRDERVAANSSNSQPSVPRIDLGGVKKKAETAFEDEDSAKAGELSSRSGS